MNKLKIDEVSGPVRSPFGWHLILVEERRTQDVTQERKRDVGAQRDPRAQGRRAVLGVHAPGARQGLRRVQDRREVGRASRRTSRLAASSDADCSRTARQHRRASRRAGQNSRSTCQRAPTIVSCRANVAGQATASHLAARVRSADDVSQPRPGRRWACDTRCAARRSSPSCQRDDHALDRCAADDLIPGEIERDTRRWRPARA